MVAEDNDVFDSSLMSIEEMTEFLSCVMSAEDIESIELLLVCSSALKLLSSSSSSTCLESPIIATFALN